MSGGAGVRGARRRREIFENVKSFRVSSVEGSRREPPAEGTLAWVRQKGCFGADDKVVLASTGREAYAGGGFHRGVRRQNRGVLVCGCSTRDLSRSSTILYVTKPDDTAAGASDTCCTIMRSPPVPRLLYQGLVG